MCTGGGQFVGIGLGSLFTVQQRVGDLVNAVVVPSGCLADRFQNGAVITAQCRAVDDDHFQPVQAAQGAGVEDQLSAVGKPAAQRRGERLAAHVRGPGHPGLDRGRRVFGAAAGHQRTGRCDQRAVGRRFDIGLHRPGHRALLGVHRRVDGAADHDV